uniref:CX domain-containing protein n=1 Tax=Caenorhabditis japonica TaxID=281687 RepID=A0A8R1HP46_CAEJA
MGKWAFLETEAVGLISRPLVTQHVYSFWTIFVVKRLVQTDFCKGIYFPDGDALTEVVFGCESSKECCGLKCCGDDVLINIIIVGAISLALLFLLLCNILIGFKKRQKDRRDVTSTYQVAETTNDIDMVSPDQITYEARHPTEIRGSANPNVIEAISMDKRV